MSYVSDNRVWLEPYVRQLQVAMGLGCWFIEISDEPPRPDCSASTDISENYLYAKLMIDNPEDEPDSPELALRRIIAHELMHLHVHDWTQVLQDAETHFNPAAWHLLDKQAFRAMERMVDTVARRWAETLPLSVKDTEA